MFVDILETQNKQLTLSNNKHGKYPVLSSYDSDSDYVNVKTY